MSTAFDEKFKIKKYFSCLGFNSTTVPSNKIEKLNFDEIYSIKIKGDSCKINDTTSIKNMIMTLTLLLYKLVNL